MAKFLWYRGTSGRRKRNTLKKVPADTKNLIDWICPIFIPITNNSKFCLVLGFITRCRGKRDEICRYGICWRISHGRKIVLITSALLLSPLGEELKSVGKRYSHAYLYELFTWNWLMIYRLYWKLWVVEFLPTMTRRVKWCEQASPMKERDVVFICD